MAASFEAVYPLNLMVAPCDDHDRRNLHLSCNFQELLILQPMSALIFLTLTINQNQGT